jgi:hypothetical protein
MNKVRKQILLHPEEVKKADKKAKEKGLSFSTFIGQLIRKSK